MKYNNYYYCNLSKIILQDLLHAYKTQLILLSILTISSILLITIIHKTRLLITEETKLQNIESNIKQKWSYLLLKKHLLLSRNYIENSAINKLKMTYIPIEHENIIFQ